jgi:hypothetical protein
MEHDATPAHVDSSASRLTICLRVSLLLFGIVTVRGLLAQPAHSLDQLSYIKVMKGSVPEYQAITVNVNGAGTYDGRKLDESPRPRSLKLSAATTQALFGLAHSLGDFRSLELESHKKVANLGLKTFVYEHDGHENKIQFNYTMNRKAQELTGLFEGIAVVEQHIGSLEFSAKYDRLGLPRELTQIEIDLNNKVLVDPQLMVPILQKIADNSEFLHIAQIRAVNILHRIHNPK